jgi:hypothetical protein
MSVKSYELWHGLVLTKLLRSDRPIALRMIQTNPAENWSSYLINDAIDLFICFSTAGRRIKRGETLVWRFNFSPNQARQLQKSDREVWAALVCGVDNDVSLSQICLLKPEEITQAVDFSKEQPGVSVRVPTGKKQICVMRDRKEIFKVQKARIDSWEIPGS